MQLTRTIAKHIIILSNNHIKVDNIPYNLDNLSIKDLINLENQLIIIIDHSGLINYLNYNFNNNNNTFNTSNTSNKNNKNNNILSNIEDSLKKIDIKKLTTKEKDNYNRMKNIFNEYMINQQN